ncbi:MAG: class I SAM-dependent methyltransferase [Gemmatimonadota bacterium]|nr:MAG: class I SAM-dependent methyltransferase [Gemmatimonadota bacterium]
MDPHAMIPHGLALLAYFDGEASAQLVIRRDDGFEASLPASHFFRQPAQFSPIEVAALERCRGAVLDIGAGTGLHSLDLLSQGRAVTAIDISPQAVEVMARRGVPDVHCADIFHFQGGPFDTLLMLGHGIGIVEDLQGLSRFLAHACKLTRSGGRLLLDSQDVRKTDDPHHLAYHEANRRAGEYIGATRLQFEYAGQAGPYCGWLHVDPQTLREQAEPAGWECEIVLEQESGDYLACLTCLQAD